MSIIKSTKTQAQIVTQQKELIVKKSKLLYNKIKARHEEIFNLLWENSKVTPQEILDKYGTEAKDLFIFSEKIQTLLKQVDPSYEELETPNEYTVLEDGSVEVGSLKKD